MINREPGATPVARSQDQSRSGVEGGSRLEFTRRLLKLDPDDANEIREEEIERGIERGIDTHGAVRLGGVVLDLSSDELDRWLGAPAAR